MLHATLCGQKCSLHLQQRPEQLKLGMILPVVVRPAPTNCHVQTTAARNNNEQNVKETPVP